MKLKAVLVDDEAKAIHLLRSKLRKLCPEIFITEVFTDPEEAVIYLDSHEIDVLFLDVAMPVIDGFELLEKLKNPSFELVFVTAYDEYAIDAIQNCAIGYLLKPIDDDQLLKTFKNIKKNHLLKQGQYKNEVLLENLSKNSFKEKKIVVPTTEGLDVLEISNIRHCEGFDGYTKIFYGQKSMMVSSFSIGHYVELLENNGFCLIHKSHLVNLDYIVKYLNEGYVHLDNGKSVPVARRKRKELLNILK